jgi:hypothetical protein
MYNCSNNYTIYIQMLNTYTFRRFWSSEVQQFLGCRTVLAKAKNFNVKFCQCMLKFKIGHNN